MKQVGLTGSIGMGKSTAAVMLRRLGVPVFDADREVHLLQAPGGRAVAPIVAAFPGVLTPAGGIDRQSLGSKVFRDAAALRQLEAIIHPMVQAARSRFVDAARRRRRMLVVFDIPLLFESGGDRRLDAVILVSASFGLQRQRVLARNGMTEARFLQILGRQMPDNEKRKRTQYIVETGLGKRYLLKKLDEYVRIIAAEPRSDRGKLKSAGRVNLI